MSPHTVPVASIWAQDQRRVLGSGTGMFWRVPDDFAHFRRSTIGCPTVMGRGSWEALGSVPLPNRVSIVITSNPHYQAPGAIVVGSLEEGLAVAHAQADTLGSPTIWVTGGGRVYADAMDLVDQLVVSDLELTAATGDQPVVYAPPIDPEIWVADPTRSDADWRQRSGDARWRITTWVRR